ncbi:fused MFS/spermidine synthase [Paenibacillus tengchongensis]|uniref:fused MFS/spermidine synthase n=1 Tax=Paenibacillus tengchongensis TaxID=2608684 RepID=UPI00124E3C29|nr:fused MFS/spermidine synthase [Paenibacillus tengchongensis]
MVRIEGTDGEIEVYETTELYGEKGRFRVLQFSGDAIQGALDLNRPQRVVFEYPRAIIHLMEHNAPLFHAAYIIGHGIGTLPGYFADREIRVAEASAEVLALSRSRFGYSRDNVTVGDGRTLLEGEPDRRYDYIVLDAFTAAGTPVHLVSQEFFALFCAKLHPRGAILLNLMGRGGRDQLIGAVHTTLGGAFPYVEAFALPADGPGDVRNVIMMGSMRPIAYLARQLAGFVPFTPAPGYVLRD